MNEYLQLALWVASGLLFVLGLPVVCCLIGALRGGR